MVVEHHDIGESSANTVAAWQAEPVRRGVEWISPAAFWSPEHLVPSNWHEHAPFAFWLISALRSHRVVELGTTDFGFSYLCLCQALQRQTVWRPRETAVSATGVWQGGDQSALAALIRTHDPIYGGFSRLIRSADAKTTAAAFDDGSVDLLHLDGLAFAAAQGDNASSGDIADTLIDIWKPKLSDRAVLLLHGAGGALAVSPLSASWRNLSATHPSFHFPHGQGLGLVAFGRHMPDGLRGLLRANRHEREEIRAAYARLGRAVSMEGQLQFAHSPTGPWALGSVAVSPAEALARSQESIERLRMITAHLQAACSEAQQELARLRSSLSWRMTAPLRASLARLSPSLRSGLRRGAKAAWWAATPHRLPTRLAARRSAMATAEVGQNTAAAWAVPSSGSPVLLRRELAFTPIAFHGRSIQTVDRAGYYTLDGSAPGHVYVPPRRPDDLYRRIAALTRRPVFSIVVPTYNTPVDLLNRLMASIRAQWYPHWQLVLCDDCSPSQATREALAAIDDARVDTVFLDANTGISGATNEAIERARGDYVVFVDHDDELTEDCLYELADCIARDNPDILYSDEDKVDESGHPVESYYKPDWSPDTLMSLMYFGHVTCVRRALLGRGATQLRSEFDGSQDWDLMLRLTEQTQRIAHIPRILYHWRITPNSVAASLDAKPYATLASRRARLDALGRRSLPGSVDPIPGCPGWFGVRYAVTGEPLVSIVIPTKNNARILRECIESIERRSSYKRLELVVIDNGSSEQATLDYLDKLRLRDDVTVVRHEIPFNYSLLCNVGAAAARGDVLLFLNDDMEVISADWLDRMLGYAQRSHIGAVGAKLVYPGAQLLQHVGVINIPLGPCHAFHKAPIHEPGYFMRNMLEHNWLAVTGACLMIERAKFDRVGGFDERLAVNYNDVELCFRLIEQGWFNVVCPGAELIHHESLSRGNDLLNGEKLAALHEARRLLYRLHPTFLMRDPFYSPNLSQSTVDFIGRA